MFTEYYYLVAKCLAPPQWKKTIHNVLLCDSPWDVQCHKEEKFHL